MEAEDLLPCSQKPAIGAYTETDENNAQLPTIFL
jgi:hypothetical protein